MTEQQSTISQNAGRTIGLVKNWVAEVEGRSRAIILSAIMALPPLTAWAYGVTNVLPPKCVIGGTSRWNPCTLMSEPKPPFPDGWNGLLLVALVIAVIVGAALILRPHDKNARLLFGAAGAIIGAVAGLQLVMLMGLPNASQILTSNSAWLVVPAVVGTAAAFAAISSRS